MSKDPRIKIKEREELNVESSIHRLSNFPNDASVSTSIHKRNTEAGI